MLNWLEPAEWSAWRLRVRAERAARNLTATRRDALLALLTCLSTGTQPTDREVARLACCCPRTVQRARADARALGLLDWRPTRQLVSGAWRRGPNNYAVSMPARPVCPMRQADRARKIQKSKMAWEVRAPSPALPRIGALAALAAIRERREAALRGAMSARRV